MKFPKLKQNRALRRTLEVFGGYNRRERIGDGEFSDMRNMTSDCYPVLAPRKKRGHLENIPAGVTGITANHGLCYTQGGCLHLACGKTVDLGLTDGPKQLVNMGAYVIILPDKKWVNVAALEESDPPDAWGDIEAFWNTSAGHGATYTLCKADGTDIKESEKTAIPTFKPSLPVDGDYWIDHSTVPPTLRKWNAEMGMWLADTDACLKIYGEGLTQAFSAGDAVRITGLENIRWGPDERMVYADTYSSPILACGKMAPWFTKEGEEYEYIVVPGFADMCFYTEAEISIARTMPDMDWVVECGNRLWGCKYGSTEDGFLNEIYCSKLGSFQNWNSFRGVSTDSYVASIGADGPFTGAVTCQGRPTFFKENCMIEVFGSYPAEYQVQITPCDGVRAGCEKSLALVGNVLYYRSVAGICAYDGSLPVPVGQALGQVEYENAVAGGCGSKYYISMESRDGWQLFVYDTARKLWHREDELRAVAFCTHRDTLYCLTDDGRLLTLTGQGPAGEEVVSWMVCTGQLGLSLPGSKYISRLNLRLCVEPGARVSLSVRYDHSPRWEHLYDLTGTDLRSFTVPIRPKRCDHMVLKLEGVGGVKVYAITEIIEQRSDEV